MKLFADLLCLGLAYCSWSALALAMDRHYAEIHGRAAAPPAALRRRLRWLGSLGLLASAALAVYRQGWGVGLVAAIGAMSLSGVLLVLVQSHAPARMPWLAWRVLALLPLLLVLWMSTHAF